MKNLDPRTKLSIGIMAIVAVFLTHETLTLLVEFVILFTMPFLFGMGTALFRLIKLLLPMVILVFVVALISFDIRNALLVSVRVVNLLTASYLFFLTVKPDEMGGALKKMGIPFTFVFILTTAMRYVPLIGQKVRNIMDAQISRGIDLRPRIRNAGNFLSLLIPLLVQSFVLSDALAIAMECRGFSKKDRSSRKKYHLKAWEYGLMCITLILLILFVCWERG